MSLHVLINLTYGQEDMVHALNTEAPSVFPSTKQSQVSQQHNACSIFY